MTTLPFDQGVPVIHVGIEESWRASGVLDWALHESSVRHLPIRAVHVIDERVRRMPRWDPAMVDEAAMELVDDVQTYLDGSGDASEHEVELVVGRPVEALCRISGRGQLLVVGRRGTGAFRRLLIGSTAEAVAADAPVPVVVVPDGWRAGEQTGPVLAGLHETDEQEAVMSFAVAAAFERDVPLRVMHAWDLPGLRGWDGMDLASLAAELESEARLRFNAVAEGWRGTYPEQSIEVEIGQGHPVGCLVQAAETSGAQLLVVGKRSRLSPGSKVPGSVTRGVIQHAACAVAVIDAAARG
ncbi:universal stress protein [Kribbella sp. NBC_00889]|uniref:universal stress protein n=1 Tax=Kribbella sp. NBC_00889 TaxID=2975974 RepID=UPI0038648102|nr:universal stress protein [Kribbella sp. NBC_00889]